MTSQLTAQDRWGAVLVILSVAISVVLVRVAIAYAHHRGMLDVPGQRRSHHQPTARGGGLGLILSMALCSLPAMLWQPGTLQAPQVTAFMLALLLVAGVGWWDDHRSLTATTRLWIQCLAVLGFSFTVLITTPASLWWLPVLLVAGVGSVNLHNFMDGIDALLAMQSMFMGVALAVLSWASGDTGLAWACLCMAGASLGFLFFNRPPARIFMGDVGSGALGLLIFMFIGLLWATDTSRVWAMLILASGFAIDSGLTLVSRVLRGRRWYTAHREHTYQWLVRAGWSHGRTGCLYMSWNALTIPFVWFAWTDRGLAPALFLGVYAAGAIAWWLVRSWVLRRARHGERHEFA